MASFCRSALMAVSRSRTVTQKSLNLKPTTTSSPFASMSQSIPRASRVLSALGSVETMIPLHSAVASARLRSSIAADSSCWSLLSQGEITAEKHKQAENLFVTFHCYCSRKEIQCLDVMLEDDNIVKSLAEYVSSGVIENLVLGAPSRHGFMRKFKISDTPSNVAKAAPDSAIEQACSVK